MRCRLMLIGCVVFGYSAVFSQELDNVSSFRNINSDKYIRLSGDDDFFAGTDDQYTEGLNLEFCAPSIKKFPLSYLLLHPSLAGKKAKYGLNIEQEGYTPYDLSNEAISTGDRPFAATLYLNTFMIVSDPVKRDRFASVLSTGVIGPAALGKNLQDAAHVVIHDVLPPGWTYQIHNDVILNYEVSYQHQLLAAGRWLSLDAEAMARAGTLHDRLCPAATLMVGNFDSPFEDSGHKKFSFYFFEHPEVNLVFYDATLEGGMFDRTSPYTLPASDVKQGLFRNTVGFVLVHNRFTFEYHHVYQSVQFTGGTSHSWDGIQLATAIR